MLACRTRQFSNSAAHRYIGSSISAAFRDEQAKRIQETLDNRSYIGRLSVGMQMLTRLGQTSQGHRQSDNSFHRENVREFEEICCIKLIHFWIVNSRIAPGGNDHYLFPGNQNDFMEAIGDEVKSTFVSEETPAD
jgi:hypothetical protein